MDGMRKMNPLEKCEQCKDFIFDDVQTYTRQLEAQNAELVKQVETQVPKWISAKEPPQEWRNDDRTLINYLVYLPEYGVGVGNYLGQAKTWICMGLPCEVTHWMPLPEPPKED